MSKNKTIFLTGGGSGGPVVPLLSIRKIILKKHHNIDFVWIGTKTGVEREMVEKEGIVFKAISSGRFRRYFSFKNFTDIFKIFFGCLESFFILLRNRPSLVISAGGFVSVGVAWSAWILRIPVLIHQQDIRPGLANKLMAPFARVVTTTFKKSLEDYGRKAIWTGNPIQESVNNVSKENYFEIKEGLPIILVVGGGTGAEAINELIENNIGEITKFAQIIHITGKGKRSREVYKNYSSFEFLDHDYILEALEKSELVISRAGLGFLTELSYFGKPAILIPIPDSHQEDNAYIFKEKNAAIVLNQKELTSDNFLSGIRNMLEDENLRRELSNNIKKVIKIGNDNLVDVIEELIKLN
ncbi:undecaprenyldiphospho-muramoylpentapeptide beta-N-acetylglucosaminyltransferase [bacterium]|nr:undecaprenyldiphospho-muramoylpentapeptide beta-N-acetylglucosaminyltransferase [bacterium]